VEEHSFIFDDVFDENVTNQELYVNAVQSLIESALKGTRVTCFAYGQTGSGKTYTMMGMQKGDKLIPGLFLLATEDIFLKIREVIIKKRNLQFKVWVSFYEIYSGKLYDLLNNRNILFAREDGKQVI